MTLPVPFAGVDSKAGGEASGPQGTMHRVLLFDQLRKGWSSIALGIILAGGIYPVAVVAIAGIVGMILNPLGVPELLGTAVVFTIYALISAVIGLAWANAVTVVTLPFVLLGTWSLGITCSILWFGAFWGGLVGFLAVTPFLLAFGVGDAWYATVGLGPALATVIGQVGGAWGGRRAIARVNWYEQALARAEVGPEAAGQQGFSARTEKGQAARRPLSFQFGIRQLMWAAVWLSVLLSAVRLTGIEFRFVLPVLGGWLVYQAATLAVGGLLIRRLGPWWAVGGMLSRRGRVSMR